MKKVYNSPTTIISNYFCAVAMLAGSKDGVNGTEAGWGNGKPGEQGGIGSGTTTPGGTLSKYRTNFYEEY